MRVRVCDDVEEIADGWVEQIQANNERFDVARMASAKEEVSNLLLRKVAAQKGQDPMAITCGFDDVDVLAVDYDLLYLDDAGSRTTGEGVARLARTFSKCGVIVVMNQFKGPQFDLGMRGHLDSYADVNVDAALVGSASLWRDVEPLAGQFDPTIWTPLPTLLDVARSLGTTLDNAGFDAEIMGLVGLSEAALAELSDSAYGFIDLKAETADQLAKVTVRKFLERSLGEHAPLDTLQAHAPELLYKLAAFRISKWMDRAVLRSMDVLVDCPHLIDRLPFMMDPEKLDVTDPRCWAVAAADPKRYLRWQLLEKYFNSRASAALGRVVIDWFCLTGDDGIDQLQDEYLAANPARIFLAEDTSRFVEKNALIRFRADFHNFGDRRAIEKLHNITYGPMRRVTFG